MESLRHHWGFLDGTIDSGLALAATYDPVLVTLSVVIASLAAYAVLGLAERTSAADRPLAKRSWLAAGAVTMGIGVWAMHFIGMLAFRLPVKVNYDVWITLVSVAPAVLASGIMLHVIRSEEHTSELQSRLHLVCRLLLEKKKKIKINV